MQTRASLCGSNIPMPTSDGPLAVRSPAWTGRPSFLNYLPFPTTTTLSRPKILTVWSWSGMYRTFPTVPNTSLNARSIFFSFLCLIFAGVFFPLLSVYLCVPPSLSSFFVIYLLLFLSLLNSSRLSGCMPDCILPSFLLFLFDCKHAFLLYPHPFFFSFFFFSFCRVRSDAHI